MLPPVRVKFRRGRTSGSVREMLFLVIQLMAPYAQNFTLAQQLITVPSFLVSSNCNLSKNSTPIIYSSDGTSLVVQGAALSVSNCIVDSSITCFLSGSNISFSSVAIRNTSSFSFINSNVNFTNVSLSSISSVSSLTSKFQWNGGDGSCRSGSLSSSAQICLSQKGGSSSFDSLSFSSNALLLSVLFNLQSQGSIRVRNCKIVGFSSLLSSRSGLFDMSNCTAANSTNSNGEPFFSLQNSKSSIVNSSFKGISIIGTSKVLFEVSLSSNLSLESTFFSNITSWTKNESDNSNSILLYISSSSNLTSSSVNIESISLNPGYIFFSDDAGQIILDGSISSNSVSSILYTAGSSAFQLGYSSGLSVFNNSYGLFATFGGFPSIHIGSVSNTLSASNSWINNRMLVFNDNVDKRSAVSVMNAFLNYASRTSMIWVGNDLAIYLNQTNNSGLLSNAFIQNPVVGEIVVTSIYGGDVFYSAPIPNNWFITETVVITLYDIKGSAIITTDGDAQYNLCVASTNDTIISSLVGCEMFNTNGQQNMSLDLSFQIQNFGSTLPSSTRFYFGTDPITQNSSVNNAYIDVEICQSYLLKGSTGNSCLDAKCDSYAGARLAVSVTSIFIAGFSILGEFCLHYIYKNYAIVKVVNRLVTNTIVSGNVLAILSLCAEVATTATAKCSAMNWLKVSGYLFTQIGIGIRMYNICKYRRRRHYNEINGSVFEVDTINIVKARLNHTHKHHHRSSKRQRSKVSFTGRFYPSEHRETSWIGYYFCWSVAVLLILTFMLCWMFIEPSGFKDIQFPSCVLSGVECNHSHFQTVYSYIVILTSTVMATVSLSQQHVKQHFNSSFYIFAISITFITMEIIGIFINPKKIDTGSAGNVLYSSNAFLIPYQIMLLVRIFMILLPHTLSLVLFMLKTIILCKFRPQDCEVIDYHDRNEISRSSSDYGLSGKKRSKGGISGAGGGGIGVRSNEDEDWSSSPSASSPQPSRNHNSKIEQINKIKSNLRFLNSAQHHTNGNGGGDVDDPTAGYDVNDVSPARPSVESQMSTENSVVEASNASFISDHSSILEHLWNNSGNDVNDGAGTKSNRLASSSNPDDISASPLDEETAALSDSGNHRDLVRSDAASDRSSTRAGPSVNNAEINNNNSSGRRRNSLDSMDHHESVLHSVLLDDFIDNPVRVQPKTLDDMIQDFEKCVFKNL